MFLHHNHARQASVLDPEYQSLERFIVKKSIVTTVIVALLSSGVIPLALAQTEHAGHHGTEHAAHHGSELPTDVADSKVAEGTVKKIDKVAGKVTIAHGPLESLGMPAMTMMFRAAEMSLLDRVQVGDKIRFTAERADGELIITSLEAEH